MRAGVCTTSVRSRPAGRKENLTGISFKGHLNIVEGKLYMNEVPLAQVLAPYEGTRIFLDLIRPDPDDDLVIDENIKPLVDALNKTGFHVLACCEGHIGKTYETALLDRAYVTFYEKEGHLFHLDYPGWQVIREPFNVTTLSSPVCSTHDELVKRQKEAREIASLLTA